MPSFLYRLRRDGDLETSGEAHNHAHPPATQMASVLQYYRHERHLPDIQNMYPHQRPRHYSRYISIREWIHCCKQWREQHSRLSLCLLLCALVLSLVVFLCMMAALGADHFANIHTVGDSHTTADTIGAFSYCGTHPSSSSSSALMCHRINTNCEADDDDSITLASMFHHHSSAISCARFEAFRAFFVLSFISCLFLPPLSIMYTYRLTHQLFIVMMLSHGSIVSCAVMALLFFSPMLPHHAHSSTAEATLRSSYYLTTTAALLAGVCLLLIGYERRQKTHNQPQQTQQLIQQHEEVQEEQEEEECKQEDNDDDSMINKMKHDDDNQEAIDMEEHKHEPRLRLKNEHQSTTDHEFVYDAAGLSIYTIDPASSSCCSDIEEHRMDSPSSKSELRRSSRNKPHSEQAFAAVELHTVQLGDDAYTQQHGDQQAERSTSFRLP